MKKRLKETLKTQIAARAAAADDDENESDQHEPIQPVKSSSSRKKTSETPKRGSARKTPKKPTTAATERWVLCFDWTTNSEWDLIERFETLMFFWNIDAMICCNYWLNSLSSSPSSIVRRSSRIRNNSGSSNAGTNSDSDASSVSSSTSERKKKTKKTARKKLELDPIEENKEVVFSPPRSKKSAPVEVSSANNDSDSELITFS